MSQFRKKPIVIEAFLWTGGPDQEEDPTWFLAEMAAGRARIKDGGSRDVHILIDTLEGTMRASQGDYIIKGVKGEVYPCKPDIFAATYEAVPAAT